MCERWCDKDVCDRWRVTKMCVTDGVCGKDVCDRCYVCRQSQPSAIRATPATQSDGRCGQVPRLPRDEQVGVTSTTAATRVSKLCVVELCVSSLWVSSV